MTTILLIILAIGVILPIYGLWLTDTRSDAREEAERQILDIESRRGRSLPAWKRDGLIKDRAERLRQLPWYK